jgi:hypothetical protein
MITVAGFIMKIKNPTEASRFDSGGNPVYPAKVAFFKFKKMSFALIFF